MADRKGRLIEVVEFVKGKGVALPIDFSPDALKDLGDLNKGDNTEIVTIETRLAACLFPENGDLYQLVRANEEAQSERLLYWFATVAITGLIGSVVVAYLNRMGSATGSPLEDTLALGAAIFSAFCLGALGAAAQIIVGYLFIPKPGERRILIGGRTLRLRLFFGFGAGGVAGIFFSVDAFIRACRFSGIPDGSEAFLALIPSAVGYSGALVSKYLGKAEEYLPPPKTW